MIMRLVPVCWLVMGLAACEPGARSGADPLAQLERAVALLDTFALSPRGEPACGTAAAEPVAVVAASAASCLSCRNLGGLLRQYLREQRAPATRLWVLTPPADTALVCEYMRREKLRAPVFAAGGDALWVQRLESDALFVARTSEPPEWLLITRTTTQLQAADTRRPLTFNDSEER